eukprot:7576647-Ditylum_brightwellii.AAC.1
MWVAIKTFATDVFIAIDRTDIRVIKMPYGRPAPCTPGVQIFFTSFTGPSIAILALVSTVIADSSSAP